MATKINTPVTGKRVFSLMIRAGATSTNAASKVLSVAPAKYESMVGIDQDKPIDDVSMAMYVRLLEKYTDRLPRKVDPVAFYDAIGGGATIPFADFCIILGREVSAARRWQAGRNVVSPAVANLIDECMSISNGDARRAWEMIMSLSSEEAAARGIDPVSQKTWSKSRMRDVVHAGRGRPALTLEQKAFRKATRESARRLAAQPAKNEGGHAKKKVTTSADKQLNAVVAKIGKKPAAKKAVPTSESAE